MPRPGQIIPKYLHPHVMGILNDNTIFEDVVAVPENGPSITCVFTAGEGRDGVFLDKQSPSAFIEEYGYPNARTDGQAVYNALAALTAGKVRVNAMRVMPEDAGYSNVVVVAKVKKDIDASQLLIKYEAICHTSVLDKGSFESLTDGLETAEDAEGYVTIPVFAFRSLGRGTYGNSFAIRVTPSIHSDKENGFKTFRFEVLKASNGVKQLEAIEGSLYIDAVTSSGTKFIADVVNDSDNASNKISMYVVPSALDKIYAMYKETNPETTINDWEFDMLFGKSMTGLPVQGIDIETEGNPLLGNEGMRLSYGDDGSFNMESPNSREDAISIMYTKAFKGELDRTILSKRRMPSLLLLDANYSEEVKRAMVELCIKRGDCRLYLDSGIITTLAEAIEYGKSIADISDHIISKEFQHYVTRDPYTGRNMTVTTTYFLASALVNHINTVGQHVPFTGETYAKLTGHNKNSLIPVVDVDDAEMKEELYLLRMNYYEAIGENLFIRATQSTSQDEWSDLSEENNSHTVLKVKNILEKLVYSLTYNFANEEDRLRFTEDAERLVEHMKGRELDTIKVTFNMSPWEAERSILHCYAAIQFKGIAKRGIVEIDINKRV